MFTSNKFQSNFEHPMWKGDYPDRRVRSPNLRGVNIAGEIEVEEEEIMEMYVEDEG